jgi:hypothetical protein
MDDFKRLEHLDQESLSPPRPMPTDTPVSTSPLGPKFKKFSFRQIKDRLSERNFVPGYASLLMQASVHSDTDSFTFNVRHPSWTQLHELVKLKQLSPKDAASDPTLPSRQHWISILGIDLAKVQELQMLSPDLRATQVVDLDEDMETDSPVFLDIPVDHKLVNHDVIKMDVKRTRQDIEFFKLDQTRSMMVWILAQYCSDQVVNYKQGMNFVLAPLMVPEVGIEGCYLQLEVFKRLIQRLLPNVFTDDEFGSLQCLFKVFRLMIQYFDPQLHAHLERNEMSPELFASPFFLTLLGNRLKIHVLLHFWDKLISPPAIDGKTADPAVFHYFCWLSLLLWNRDELLSHDLTLPETLNKITIASIDEADVILKRAEHLFDNVPYTVVRLLNLIVSQDKLPVDSPLFETVMSYVCLPFSAADMTACMLEEKNADSPFYKNLVILDCRPAISCAAGHFPLFKNIDPEIYDDHTSRSELIHGLEPWRGSSVCFIIPDAYSEIPKKTFQEMLKLLLITNWHYVSVCDGGFSNVHSHLQNQKMIKRVLIDHDERNCVECIKQVSKSSVEFSPLKFAFSRISRTTWNQAKPEIFTILANLALDFPDLVRNPESCSIACLGTKEEDMQAVHKVSSVLSLGFKSNSALLSMDADLKEDTKSVRWKRMTSPRFAAESYCSCVTSDGSKSPLEEFFEATKYSKQFLIVLLFRDVLDYSSSNLVFRVLSEMRTIDRRARLLHGVRCLCALGMNNCSASLIKTFSSMPQFSILTGHVIPFDF